MLSNLPSLKLSVFMFPETVSMYNLHDGALGVELNLKPAPLDLTLLLRNEGHRPGPAN